MGIRISTEDKRIVRANAPLLAEVLNKPTNGDRPRPVVEWTPERVLQVFENPQSPHVRFDDRLALVVAGMEEVKLNLSCWKTPFLRVQFATLADRSQVARAVAGDAGVNAQLRAQILQAVKRFNYIPKTRSESSRQRSAKGGVAMSAAVSPHRVAWLVPYRPDEKDPTNYWTRFSAAIRNESERAGLTFVPSGSLERPGEPLLGVVVWGVPNSDQCKLLNQIRVPVVFLNTSYEDITAYAKQSGLRLYFPPTQRVGEREDITTHIGPSDPSERIPFVAIGTGDKDAMQEVVHHLLAAGVSRPILIRGPQSQKHPWGERIAGYQAAIGDPQKRLIVPSLEEEDRHGTMYLPEHGRRCIKALLEGGHLILNRQNKPAIVAANDGIAQGVIEVLRDAHPERQLGADYLLTGWDDSAIAEHHCLTSVVQPCEELVSESVRALFALYHCPSLSASEITVPCQLRIRRSTMGTAAAD